MVEKASIKNTFILSQIFETREDVESCPFEFSTENTQPRGPNDIPNALYKGYLLRLQVSRNFSQ